MNPHWKDSNAFDPPTALSNYLSQFGMATGRQSGAGRMSIPHLQTKKAKNWGPHNLDPKPWPSTAQVLEVTSAKKIVWALSEWKNPDLGQASLIQLLDEPGTPEIPGEQQR
jgi:hypothetical protein